jgi:hypothetical protein
MARIKVTDSRQGRTFRTGINGRFYDIPLNTDIEVEDEMVEHLKGLGVAFDEVSTKGSSASKEGSVDVLAPAALGPNDVIAPADAPRSQDDPSRLSPQGDQPGDVTAAGGLRTSTGQGSSPSIAEDAKVSDIRVAAERQTKADAPVAEKAGEGEGGTDAASVPKPAPQKAAKTAPKKK